MSLFDKLFGKHKEDTAAETAEAPKEIDNTIDADDADPDMITEEEEKMLALLEKLDITGMEDKSSNFTVMHFYRFSSPFDDDAMINIVKGIRWIGMRFYGFTTTSSGTETACPNWVSLLRAIAEDSAELVSLSGIFGGVRLTASVSREGLVTFCHDISREIDLTPFIQLFEPEQAEEEP